MGVEFRPCVPSDVDEAVPLIFSSGPPAFNFVFTNGKVTAVDFLKYAFQRNGGEFSYDNHFAMLKDQKLIGVGSVFSGVRANGFMLSEIRNITSFYKIGAMSVLLRGLKIEKTIKPPTKNEISIAHLAINEKERSKGYGEKLVRFLLQEANKSDSNYYVLDVSEENPRAKQLYDRMGFIVHSHNLSSQKTEHGYIANHYRMHL